MTTITVLDSDGTPQTIAKVADTGSAADAASLPVAQSTEHKAAIGALTETAPANDTASSGLNGRLQRIAQRITSLIALLPTSLGAKAGSGSLSVVESAPTTTNISAQTSATGSAFVAFSSSACTIVRIVNAWTGATDIEVRRGSSGVTIPVPAGAERAFDGVTNASDLQVRRIDQSNTQVTIYCEAVTL